MCVPALSGPRTQIGAECRRGTAEEGGGVREARLHETEVRGVNTEAQRGTAPKSLHLNHN